MSDPWNYMPRQHWQRGEPLDRLPCADELAAELAEAIARRLELGERHTHPKKGGCQVCADAAADTVVRFLEFNTRVVKSEALAPEEHATAKAILGAVPHLHSGFHMRLAGDLARDPAHPTVGDLLADLATLCEGVKQLRDREHQREAELRKYRAWREAVSSLAAEAVQQWDQLNEADRPKGATA